MSASSASAADNVMSKTDLTSSWHSQIVEQGLDLNLGPQPVSLCDTADY